MLKPPRAAMSGTMCVVTFLALATLLSGCGSSEDRPQSVPDSSSTTVAVSSDDRVILDSYSAYWDAYFKAADPMDPDNPVLAQHATGQQLAQIQNAFLARRSAGQVFRGRGEFAPKVVTRTQDTATVDDCYLDKGEVIESVTGNVISPAATERQRVLVNLRLENGSWKVASTSPKEKGCVPS